MMLRDLIKRIVPSVGMFSVLAIQNLAIFWGHYFSDVGFPWDFPLAYYAFVAHWTSAVSKGIFPEWIPFQQMGYPLALQTQSGLYYPPLWIFPIFKIPYTLNAAAAVQCLHILVGAFGMFLFLRIKLSSNTLSCLGAFLFQFFGGFYSNAEHVDIIRAFVFAPWLLYCFSLDNSSLLSCRNLSIPFFVYLLVTGAYPGNVFSTLFILATYIFLQLLTKYQQLRRIRPILSTGIAILTLTLLGIALSAIHIGPILSHREQFVRLEYFDAIPNSVRYSVTWAHFPGLFLSNRTLPGEISMTSTYVTLPALILASFVSLGQLKKYWIDMTIGSIAALMAAGPQSPLWVALTTFPLLKISRHPSSDYRVFVAIPIILLAVLGFQSVLNKELTGRTMIGRMVVVATWFFTGLYAVYRDIGVQVISALVVANTTLVLIWLSWIARSKHIVLTIPVLFSIVTLDAWRVLPDIPTWQEPAISSYYSRRGWPYATSDNRLIVSTIFDSLPARRPAREVPAQDFTWRGYLDGHYLTTDIYPSILKTAHTIESNKLYFEWMQTMWTPIFLDIESVQNRGGRINIPDTELSTRLNSLEPSQYHVSQVHYGINDITYLVSLPKALLMIENETYFPGWTGKLIFPDRTIEIQAIGVNNVLRGWLLPAGEYRMETRFEFPHSTTFRSISLGALGVWIFVLLRSHFGQRCLFTKH